MTAKLPAPRRADFPALVPITTRWADNDAFGHVNNVAYYAFFDTAVNVWLLRHGLVDIHRGARVFFVVETGCRYRRPLSYPEPVEVGLRVARLGTSSVRYDVAVFGPGHEAAAAEGHFTHVYVERASGRPSPIPDSMRAAFSAIAAP